MAQNFQDLVLHEVHGLTTALANERVGPIYTIFEGWGVGLQCRRRERDGRSLPVLGTVGKLFQATVPGVGGRSQKLPERGKSNFTVVVCFLTQCDFR